MDLERLAKELHGELLHVNDNEPESQTESSFIRNYKD
jgi:hypothetical protein